MPPSINDLKVYTPAQDFELSKRFYSRLGFELTDAWAGDVDCRLGGAQFRLQKYYVKDWANNFMMLFGVDDARAWYDHAKAVLDAGDFGPARVSELEVVGDSKIVHVHDPSGVLLIFVE